MSDRSPQRPDTAGPLPVHVVMVEDDAAVRALVTTIREQAKLSMEACPLGWRAHLCIRNALPKLIILDVRLPEVDGVQLFYLVRGDAKTKDIPVIFLAADPEKVRRELPNYEEMGAVLLPKPFMVNDLLELVLKAIGT